MRQSIVVLIGLQFLGITSIAQTADADPQRWRARVGGIWTLPDGELQLDRGARKVVNIDVEGGIGYHIGLEYLIGEKAGLEIGMAQSRMEYFDKETFATGEVLQSSDQLRFTMITAAFNYHLLKDSKLDPFLSVQLGYVSYGDKMQITTELPSPSLGPDPNPELVTFDLHAGASLGLGAGLDFEISDTWMIGLKTQLNVNNLEASIINDPEDDGRDIDLSVNPIVVGIHLAKSF